MKRAAVALFLAVCIDFGVSTLQEKFKCETGGNYLKEGFGYHYDHVGEATAEAVGTTDRVSGIKYKCRIVIIPYNGCEFHMLVKDCELLSVPAPGNQKKLFSKDGFSKSFQQLMSNYWFVFHMSDGKIVNIIDNPKDPLWIVNIKRAMASNFLISSSESEQTGEWKLHTDVQGTCPRRVIRTSEDGEDLQTEKKFHFCRLPGRQYWQLSPFSLFNNMSFIQNVINSSVVCQYNIESGTITTMKCNERHAIMLESSDSTASSIQSNIRQSLKLVKKKAVNEKSKVDDTNKLSSIVYEYEHITKLPANPKNFEKKAYKMIDGLVVTSSEEIRLFTATIFTELLDHLRSSPDVAPLVQGVLKCEFRSSCSDAQKEQALVYLQDALTQCNTIACLKGFRTLASKVSKMYFNHVMWSLSRSDLRDPEYITEVMLMCRERQTRACWLSLGTIIGKIADNHPGLSGRQFPDPMYNAVKYILDETGSNCAATVPNDEVQTDHILTMILTMKNIGPVLHKISPTSESKMYLCVKNKNVPTETIVAAMEVKSYGSLESNEISHYLTVVGDENEEVRIRVSSYLALAKNVDGYDKTKQILDAMKKIESKQVRTFMKTHIFTEIRANIRYAPRITEFDPTFFELGPRPFGNKQYSDNLMKLFEEEGYTNLLERKTTNGFDYSSIVAEGGFIEYRELYPKYANSEGYVFSGTKIYEPESPWPRFVSQNHTFEIFSKVVNIFESGMTVKGFDSIIDEEKIGYIYPFVMQHIEKLIFKKESKIKNVFSDVNSKYDGIGNKILDNIRRLHSTLSQVYKDDPYIMSYVKMFGKYSNVMTMADIKELINNMKMQIARLPHILGSLQRGVKKRHTSVVKVVEAYYQVPTTIGLPLNWTTDATLSVSAKTGFKISMAPQKSNFFVYPSAALTFVNSMSVVLPTVTVAGIRANSSMYTSTTWNFELLKDNKDMKLSVTAPTKPQEVLNLFRYNSIIRGNVMEKLPDHDVKRKSESWCMEGKFQNVTGMKLCHERSHADVINDSKPWFPMAGWAKWMLTLHKTDRNLKKYEILIKPRKSENMVKLHVDMQAKGSNYDRTVNALLRFNKASRHTFLKISAPEVPNFDVEFNSKSGRSDSKIWLKYKSSAGNLYKTSYESKSMMHQQKIKKPSKNSSPKAKYSLMAIRDHKFVVVVPGRTYRWTYKTQKQSGVIVGNMLFKFDADYENSWLRRILPEIYWEKSQKTAWVLLKARLNPKIRTGDDTWKSYHLYHVNVPHADLEFHVVNEKTDVNVKYDVKVKKIETGTKKLLSFADFLLTRDLYDESTSVRNTNVNLTVPRYSFALDVQEASLAKDDQLSIKFTASKMIPKTESGWLHIGWWNPNSHKDFDHSSWYIKYDRSFKNNKDEWPIKSIVDSSDLTTYGGKTFVKDKIEFNKIVDTKLEYPWAGDYHTMSAKVKLVSDALDNPFSILRVGQIESSYHENKFTWTSYSGYDSEDGLKLATDMKYQHTPTAFAGIYVLRLDHQYKPWNIQLRHSLTTPHYNFSSEVRTQPKPNVNDLVITIDSNSDVWDELNTKLYQYFHFEKDGWESMNFSSPSLIANVTARWTDPWYKTYKKNIVIDSKTKIVPSMEIDLTYNDVSSFNLNIDFKDSGNSIIWKRNLSENKKSVESVVDYVQNGESEEMINVMIRILNPRFFAGNFTHSPKTLKAFYGRMYKRFRIFVEKFRKAEVDPKHPMNKFLKRALGGRTWAEHKIYVRNETKEFFEKAKGRIYAVVKTWEVIYAPPYAIPVNAVKELKKKMAELDIEFRKTFTGWAWYYFDIPSLLNSPEYRTLVRQDLFYVLTHKFIVLQRNGFLLTIYHPFYWPKLNSKPKLMPEIVDAFRGQYRFRKTSPEYPEYQFATIDGNNDVYTFDKKAYKLPPYPVDGCTHILAHDVKTQKFSLLKTKTSTILVLHDTTLTIDKDNKIYVNTSKVALNLPAFVNNRVAISSYPKKVVVNSVVDGFYIMCSSEDQICIFKLSKKHRGKVAGLFGNFDGESFNDFMLPTGDRTKSVYSFVSSYEVSGKKGCKDEILMKSKETECTKRNADKVKQCDQLFNNGILSFNYHCFGIIDPEPYYKTCIRESKCPDPDMCGVNVAYVVACYNKGVRLFHTMKCDKCHEKRKKFYLPKVSRQVEFVVIVDENKDLFQEAKNLKGFQNLIERIDKSFKQLKGYSYTAYSLVTFGGSGPRVEPLLHTIGKDNFVDVNTFLTKSLKNLKFNGDRRVKAIEGLKFAGKYVKFVETSSSKVFLLLTVDDRITVMNPTDLNLPPDVTLYTFANYPSVKKGKHIYGVRRDGYVIPHPIEAKRADREELFVRYPSGPLAKATAATNGAIFQRNFVEENSPSNFFVEVAEEILAKVGKELTKRVSCSCWFDSFWDYKLNCNKI